MIKNDSINELAILGGGKLFAIPKSTSNLLQPDIEKYLGYSKIFFEEKRYTNNGPNVTFLEERLARFHQVKYCVTFSSGFWALALAIRLLATKGKTEIIMPSLTYRRMADIAAWVNLKPHYCEVEPESLAMSVVAVDSCINENTALILGVHPIVNCCDTEGLVELARENNIPILFDSVESVYESTAAGKVGGFGEAECFSLHACKLLNGFGGGYLTTNSQYLAKELASVRSFGFTDVDYVGVTGGLNAKLNEMHAAMAMASLDDLDDQITRNREHYYQYKLLLDSVPGLSLIKFDERYQTAYKNIVVELLDEWPLSREDTIKILNAENILARAYYYPPLHIKPTEYPHISANLPITDILSERFLNLPCGQLVNNDDIALIVDYLKFISVKAKKIVEHLHKVDK
ncbi:MAG: aminotransferase [Thiotrichaceae bacterium]|nr:MAG: aminotransferase [Thiotrichaceae bacterium]